VPSLLEHLFFICICIAPRSGRGIFERSEKIPEREIFIFNLFARTPVAEEGITERSDVIPFFEQL
jgi:hypothetical protein